MIRKILIVIIAVMSVSLAWADTKPSYTRQERKLISEANALYRKGDFAKAAAIYNNILSKNASNSIARYNLALSQVRSAAKPSQDKSEATDTIMQQAVANFNAVAQAVATDASLAAKAAYNLGNIAFNAEDYASAIQNYKQSLRLNPDSEPARRNLRIAQKKQQQQNQDKNKDKNQDKQDKQDKQDQKQDQQNNQDKQEQQKPQDRMNQQNADRMLNAIENKENALRSKLKSVGEKSQNSARPNRKNW